MLNFETPENRVRNKVNIFLLGLPGSGKTFAARTLDPKTTLFLDGEAGTLALGNWSGTVLNIREEAKRFGVHPWYMCRAIACVLSGPDPKAETGPYCQAAYDGYVNAFGQGAFDQWSTVFLDSCTVASKWSFDWACKQPEAFSEKTGKFDQRAAYGNHGREMIEWATQLQHQPKNIIMACILEEKEDDFSRKYITPQIVGGMAGRELPGIFDIVATIAAFPDQSQPDQIDAPRWIVTKHGNPFGFIAKDRSHLLSMYEPPDLGALINKIQSPQ